MILLFIFSWLASFQDNLASLRKDIMNIYHQYEAEKHIGHKSYQLEITDKGFVRYKKVLANNKSEFFSVKANRIKDIDFYGNENSGWFVLKCERESVIYQTRSDPSGNVDSMAHEISFPLHRISVEELNILREKFMKVNAYNTKLQK